MEKKPKDNDGIQHKLMNSGGTDGCIRISGSTGTVRTALSEIRIKLKWNGKLRANRCHRQCEICFDLKWTRSVWHRSFVRGKCSGSQLFIVSGFLSKWVLTAVKPIHHNQAHTVLKWRGELPVRFATVRWWKTSAMCKRKGTEKKTNYRANIETTKTFAALSRWWYAATNAKAN